MIKFRKNNRILFKDVSDSPNIGTVFLTDKWSLWIRFDDGIEEIFHKDLVISEIMAGKLEKITKK